MLWRAARQLNPSALNGRAAPFARALQDLGGPAPIAAGSGRPLASAVPRGFIWSTWRNGSLSDRPMDFADATLVHIANREYLTTIVSIDRNDFATYRLGRGQRFRIVSARQLFAR